jgi:hypothetical protein
VVEVFDSRGGQIEKLEGDACDECASSFSVADICLIPDRLDCYDTPR